MGTCSAEVSKSDRADEELTQRHDVDVLMTSTSDDSVFESTTDPAACGTRRVGRERVREAFARVFQSSSETRHFIAGNRGVSEWIFTGTSPDGKKVGVNGCDIFIPKRQGCDQELVLQDRSA
jgi:ketosteroid isomerase-like protein